MKICTHIFLAHVIVVFAIPSVTGTVTKRTAKKEPSSEPDDDIDGESVGTLKMPGFNLTVTRYILMVLVVYATCLRP